MKPLAQERASAADAKDMRAQRIEAVVVCSDDALLIELGPILGNRYRTHTVDAPADIGATLQASRWLGIVDALSLPDARGAVARLELQYHHCPIIVITPNPDEWAAAISRGAVTAALSREDLAGPRLSEALTAAELRLRSESAADSSVASSATQPATIRVFSSGRRPAALVGMATLLLGTLAIAASWLLHGAHSSSAGSANVGTAPATSAAVAAGPASASDTGAAAAKPQTVLELLSAARVAFSDQKLLPRADTDLRGDSALELYTQVLSQDPGNEEALDGVKRLFAAGKTRIQGDLAGGKLDDAARLVGLLKSAGVNGDALRDIEASINAAKPRWAAIRAQQDIAAGDVVTAEQLIGQMAASGDNPNTIAALRHALEAKNLDIQLTAMAKQVKAAIDAGALLEPANDNARTRLAAMRAVARTQPQTSAAAHELQGALIQRAQQATRAGQFDQAQRYLGAAAELGNGSPISDAKRQLQTELDAASQRAAASAAVAKSQLQATVAAGSASARAPSPPGKPAATRAAHYIAARPTRTLDVAYPAGATADGYVVVEFTLAPDGTASQLKIVEAKPSGIFEQTALDAVAQGHYDTHQLIEQHPAKARILLRFKH